MSTINFIFNEEVTEDNFETAFEDFKEIIRTEFMPKFDVVNNKFYYTSENVYFNIKDSNKEDVVDKLVSVLNSNKFFDWDYCYDDNDEFFHDGYCEFAINFGNCDFILQFHY